MLFNYPIHQKNKELPRIPIILQNKLIRIQVIGLLDSGASVNVLPYRYGVALGLIWQLNQARLTLAGNLANYEAQPIILIGEVEGYTPVRLSFAWSQSDYVPLILGNTNFFDTFNVCFLRATGEIEIKPVLLQNN